MQAQIGRHSQTNKQTDGWTDGRTDRPAITSVVHHCRPRETYTQTQDPGQSPQKGHKQECVVLFMGIESHHHRLTDPGTYGGWTPDLSHLLPAEGKNNRQAKVISLLEDGA